MAAVLGPQFQAKAITSALRERGQGWIPIESGPQSRQRTPDMTRGLI
jgi:hypothetical protein